jgi:hypothetical protein
MKSNNINDVTFMIYQILKIKWQTQLDDLLQRGCRRHHRLLWKMQIPKIWKQTAHQTHQERSPERLDQEKD